MNFKTIILSAALILGSCSDTVLVAQPNNEQSELIKKAKSAFDELKTALKCVFRKKGCDEKKRKEIITKGLAVLGVVAVLTGAIWRFKPLSLAAAKKAYDGILNSLDMAMKADEVSNDIANWLGSMRGSRAMTIDEVAIERYKDTYNTEREEADAAYERKEFQKAHRLLKKASQAIREAERRYNIERKKSEAGGKEEES